MSDREKLSIELPEDLATEVRRAVDGGDYSSRDAVIQTALREWSDRRAAVHRLRSLWDEGVKSGTGKLGSIDAIKKEARKRFAEK